MELQPSPQSPSQNPAPAPSLAEPARSIIPTPVLWTLCVLVFAGIFFVNQLAGHAPEAPAAETSIAAPDIDDPLLLSSRLYVKLAALAPGAGASFVPQIKQLAAQAKSNADLLRMAILLGEFEGSAAGLAKLDELGAKELKGPDAVLADDVPVVRALLTDGAPRPDAAQLAALAERHGFYAQLAQVRGLPSTDPARARIESGGVQIALVGLCAVAAAALAFFGAIASVVVLLTRLTANKLRPRFERPAAPSSLYLEAFLIFLVCFLALHVGFPIVLELTGIVKEVEGAQPAPVPGWIITVRLLMQWSLMATIFWPLLRGVTWEQWKAHTGWRCPRGVAREIGAGLVGYGATLPALVLAAIVVIVYMALQKAANPDAAPPSNPVAELLGSAGGFDLLLLFGMMTVWAPIVEETFFRGMLFRQLRGSMGVIGAAVLSGLWFGLMHGYSGMLLLPVVTIGVCFAFVREWRGSLVPTVAAHALHNFAIGALAIGFFTAIK